MQFFSGPALTILFRCAVAASCIAFFSTQHLRGQSASASGGIADSATSVGLRARLSAGEIRALLPERGAFTFPSPYLTQGVRLTNASDCGGGDCVVPVGYSYWSNINNHTASDTMLVLAGLERRSGGAGPSLFSFNKRTGETRNQGPIFPPDSPYSWANAEGWYFSATQPNTLYFHDGPRIRRYDLVRKVLSTVFDVTSQFGADKVVWQVHSSNDDRVHSATMRRTGSWEMLGCVVYDEGSSKATFFAKRGDYDECQIDRSGRWLVIKENVDGAQGEDNRIVDLRTGTERLLTDPNGAGGHSDLGFGFMVAEDNYHSQPAAVRLWNFALDVRGGQPASVAGQGVLVYELASWLSGIGHIAFGGARPDVPIERQRACASNASRHNLPRVNEIVCFPLDGSLDALVVAPNLTDLDASGGGADDYSKLPKGNLDITGEYFVWTANAGTSRLDMFIVRVPGGAGSPPGSGGSDGDDDSDGGPEPEPAPTPKPTPIGTLPTPGLPGFSAVAVSWTDVIKATASGNDLRKSAGCDGCKDAGGRSAQSITAGDAAVWFTAPGAQAVHYVGLGAGKTATNPGAIKFALRLGDNVAEVREAGRFKADVRVSRGDVLAIGVESGVVAYFKNGVAFYSSASRPVYPLFVNAALLARGATATDVMLWGERTETSPGGTSPPAAVSWVGAANVSAEIGALTKVRGCDGCPDAGASSLQRLRAGDGGVSFRIAEADSLRFVALSADGVFSEPMALRFALRIAHGRVEVREAGVYKTDIALAAGDTLAIAVRGGRVEYSRNGSVFYTSSSRPTYPLVVDAALLDAGSSVSSVRMFGD